MWPFTSKYIVNYFAGKERGSESGFYYFGARRYNSELLMGWLSVDPMADDYPDVSDYSYCEQNPMKLVDPDGENPVVGAIVGSVVNGISAAVEGTSGSGIFAAAVGGAVAGACDGSVVLAAAGSAAGEFVEQGINNLFEGKSLKESVKDVDLEKVGVAAAGGVLGTKVPQKLKIDSDHAKNTIVQKTTAAKNKINSTPVQKQMHKQVVKETRLSGHPTTGKITKQQMNRMVKSRTKSAEHAATVRANVTDYEERYGIQTGSQLTTRQINKTQNND